MAASSSRLVLFRRGAVDVRQHAAHRVRGYADGSAEGPAAAHRPARPGVPRRLDDEPRRGANQPVPASRRDAGEIRAAEEGREGSSRLTRWRRRMRAAPSLRCWSAMTTGLWSGCVQGFGCRPGQPCDLRRRPASESRQGTNPRAIVRGECRALRYGDLTEEEGASAGAQSPLRRLMTRPADSRSWVCWSRLSLKVAVAGLL
jgi:hypothetical protein